MFELFTLQRYKKRPVKVSQESVLLTSDYTLGFGGQRRFRILVIVFLTTKTSLRKHAYSNILRILLPKNENFQMKNSCTFHISAQNIEYGYLLEPPRRGGSNEYPQSMFLSRKEKLKNTPVNPSFTV